MPECSSLSAAQAPEHSGLEGLLRLRWSVVWLYPKLSRFRFRAARAASLRLIRPSNPSERTETPVENRPTLTALEKYVLLRESGERCHWCGRKFGSEWTLSGAPTFLRLHWDHVVPVSRDGATDRTNVVPSCHVCNLWKSDRLFDGEPGIRAYLEAQWTAALTANDVEDSSPSGDTAEDAPDDSALLAVLKRAGKMAKGARGQPPHIHLPETEPADSGQTTVRHLPRGTRVRVIGGAATGMRGIVHGPSRDQPEWTRVLLGAGLVPWRIDPRLLQPADDAKVAA